MKQLVLWGRNRFLVTRRESMLAKLLRKLGPGFITGASDDDPAGLATYAQSGAQFGPKVLWLSVWSLPFMVSAQEMAGRIGVVTGKGLTYSFLIKYSRSVVALLIGSLFIANVINIGADIAGMAECVTLLLPVPFYAAAILLSLGMVALQVYLPYKKYVTVLKWCTISLFSYIATACAVKMDWYAVIKGALIPVLEPASNDFWYILTAILGTTISPYLMFWQTSEEVEEMRLRNERRGVHASLPDIKEIKAMRQETWLGMAFSNLIMFFIIAVTSSVLHKAGGGATINSMADAASVLRPLAGDLAGLLFSLGVVGTGLLAIPVLAGSAAYAFADFFGWRHGLHLSWWQARKFYLVIVIATLLGLALNFLGINPIDFLLWSAIINGVVTPLILVATLLVARDRELLGKFASSWRGTAMAAITFTVFVASIVGFLVTYKRG